MGVYLGVLVGGLTQDDIEYLAAIWDVCASQTSETSKSIDKTDVKIVSEKEKKEIIKDAIKLRFCPKNDNSFRYVWCAISGERIDIEDENYKKLYDNDPEGFGYAYLIPNDYWGNVSIKKILNDGYNEKFDVNSPRNMVFCKRKYVDGMNERKISIEWRDKDGYIVFVDERFRNEYKDNNGNNVDGRKLSIYTNGKLNESKIGPNWPYQRAFALHLAVTQRRLPQVFQEMSQKHID